MQTTLSLLGLLALSFAADLPTTPMISDNIPGTAYTAQFTGSNGDGITGYVTVAANTNGTGTVINVNLANLPAQSAGGPFLYHIHVDPVPANGSCAATLGHLDPVNRGESPSCDSSTPALCQAGDLAGKYGKMTTSPWQQTYVDLFTSTTPGNAAFIGNRSITIHLANTTRIACANFKPVSVPTGSAACSSGSGAAVSSAAPMYPTGAAGGAASPTGAAGAAEAGSASSTGAASIASGTRAPSPPIVSSNGAGVTSMSLGAFALAVAAFVL